MTFAKRCNYKGKEILCTKFDSLGKCKNCNEKKDTQDKIDKLFNNFKNFLKEKNKRYGDSVINPVKMFSKVEPENKACIRLDEKLQRIINNDTGELRKNDVCDTFGYLALLMIDKGWLTFGEMLD